MSDPIADTVRSILDGHIVLSRQLAFEGQYPAIDILHSISRLSKNLTPEEDFPILNEARRVLSTYQKNQEVIRLGVYKPGSNLEIDHAINVFPKIQAFLKQSVEQGSSIGEARNSLRSIINQHPAPQA